MNTENYDNAKKILAAIEGMIANEKDADKLHGLQTARRYLKFACNHLRNDNLDDAGRCLEVAHKAFKEAMA